MERTGFTHSFNLHLAGVELHFYVGLDLTAWEKPKLDHSYHLHEGFTWSPDLLLGPLYLEFEFVTLWAPERLKRWLRAKYDAKYPDLSGVERVVGECIYCGDPAFFREDESMCHDRCKRVAEKYGAAK
jgi:hypothetical protein